MWTFAPLHVDMECPNILVVGKLLLKPSRVPSSSGACFHPRIFFPGECESDAVAMPAWPLPPGELCGISTPVAWPMELWQGLPLASHSK